MLTNLDPQSPTWRAIERWANDRLDLHRTRNESLNTPPEQTVALRGRIAEIKALLALASPDPAQVADEA